MALNKTGLAFLTQTFNPQGNFEGLGSSIDELDLKIIPARVTDIVLDETHPKFNEVGQFNGLGTIFFEKINFEDNNLTNPSAKPFFPQLKNYPLLNEIVLLCYLPDSNMGSRDTSKIYYYLNAISIWNHPHHNAYPNMFDGINDEDQRNDYKSIGAGQVRRIEDEGSEIDLGNFKEKKNINPIMSYTGDNIFEGRFGNSIRLGSTIKTNSLYRNNWSENGEQGNPITILRNGQDPDSEAAGWVPTVENINTDQSSIYLTSNQLIPIKASSTNYTGLEKSPTYPNSYKESQIILNSGRLLFNTTSDSILLSSKKSISLSANEGIGLSTSGSMAIESSELKLGASSAEQPVILGEAFMSQLEGILANLRGMAVALAGEPALKITPNIANQLVTSINIFEGNVESFKSKIVKVT